MTAQLLKAGEGWKVITADTLALLPDLPSNSVDAVVCDPPYGIDFQAEAWDGRTIRQAAAAAAGGRVMSPGEAFERWTEIWARELVRVVKPGGHVACFAAPRMTHRLTSGLENGGLEIRDVLMWMYSSGMPKSRRLADGRGTALKPAYEPVVLARVPLAGTVKATIQEWGTGAMNTEACEVPDVAKESAGRWPANVCLTHAVTCTPRQCEPSCSVATLNEQTDDGEASRFFFCSKASRRERDAGCDQLPARRLDLFPSATKGVTRSVRNPHPTVKPIAVMRWVTRLVTPEGGVVLDPFCGSGSTGAAARLEGRRFIGIERDPSHAVVARARVRHWDPTPIPAGVRRPRAPRPRGDR